jgi:hypothetical protein
MPERVFVVNNTFVGGEYGITGGDNLVIVNNVMTGIARTGLTRVHGDSVAGKNLLWKNGTDVDESDLKQDRFVIADPLLDAEFKPQPGSPCIGAGHSEFEFSGETLSVAASGTVIGRAPDLGAFEVGSP